MSTTTERRVETMTKWDVYQSPLGPLTIAGGPRGVSSISFPGRGRRLDASQRDPDALASTVAQLEEYFAGERRVFDVALDLVGTDLQLAVWGQLLEIPYGTTISYSELARRVGRPDVVRAVGACVGQTPVPIVVPCHRVIGKNGSLTGYGGGLHRKQALLELEHRTAGAPPAAWAFRQLTLV
ncbi:MAG TPA: methylated-DNA--[protein]-cysteine S-methyltransferase [Gaiellaceae bacterium]|nr:methylated-DNA--[protein]-cysteine S-methyltransferase [Gaiellaceae bacterium]